MSQYHPENLHVVDEILGGVIRVFRRDKGMSQAELARQLGISAQQVQKYEKAQNRIPASRLYAIGEILGVKCELFYYILREPEAVLVNISDNISDSLPSK